MSVRKVSGFTPVRKKTTYPYELWLDGGDEVNQLEAGIDFHRSPRAVAATINSYAKSHGFVAVAFAVRLHSTRGPLDGVEVWGDPSRPVELGVPEHVRRMLDQRRRGRKIPA